MEKLPRSLRCRHCRQPFSIAAAEPCVNCRASALVCPKCGRCSFAPTRQKGSCLDRWSNHPGRQEGRPIVVTGTDPDDLVTRLVILSDSPEAQSYACRLLELFGFAFAAEQGGVTVMKPLVRERADRADSIVLTSREIYQILREDLGDQCPLLISMMHSELASDDRIEVLGSSVVDVFSHEEMDTATARWFLEMALFGEEPLS